MVKEIPFNFRDHYPGDVQNYMDRQRYNQILREHGLPITVYCLDVFISLFTLPAKKRTFDGICEDMVTLTPPEGPSGRTPHNPRFQENELDLILQYLERKAMVRRKMREGVEIFSITKVGKKSMQEAKKILRSK